MGLVRDTVANFIGGVSQQPDKIIFPNQSKVLKNYLPSPSDGLLKRPPTEHVAYLRTALNKYPYCHTIVKEDENYEVLIDGSGALQVWDLNGNSKTVNYEASASTYITTNDPLKDLYCVTIGDYTFVANKTKTAQMKSDTYPNNYSNTALVFVYQGDYSTDYTVKVTYGNTTFTKTKTTSDDDAADTKTNKIASDLVSAINSEISGQTGWTVTRRGSTFTIKYTGGTLTVDGQDSNGDRNLKVFNNSADSVEDLPTEAPNGFILKITGEGQSRSDDYYVRFQTANNSSFGQGSWKECTAPSEKYKIDPATMPHILVRNSNGTFTLKPATWTDRKAGDNNTNPQPSFIGKTIQEVFTHKGRLAFLSDDKVIFSDTSDIFSFFKKTTLTELDSDPIDISSNSQMVLLRHSLPFNEELLLFSEDAAFTIKGGDVFSNKTVSMDMTMGYQVSRHCKPVSLGATALFVYGNGNYSRVMETYITSTYTIDARDITVQVPSYIPSGVFKIAKSTANNFAALLSTEEEDKLYCYNFYYDSEKKQQSAWHIWQFDNAKVLNADFKENWLYVVLQYADGIYLNKINFTAKNKEENLDYLFCLDRKLYYSGTYISKDTTNNTTTFILPYTPQDTLTVLDNRGFPQEFTRDYRTITVEGLFDELVTGFTYNSLWQLPKIYVREQSTNGALKVKEGILMLRDINLAYSDTGYFTVTITPKYTTNITSTFEFTGKITGLTNSQLEQIPVSDGAFLIPVIANNEEITIEIEDDNYLPCCFLSLEWLGDFTVRGQ